MATSSQQLDKIGIVLTSLCALHCLMLPILLSVLPLFASTVVGSPLFERSILTLSILVGAWALTQGLRRQHGKIYPLYLLLAGGVAYWNKGALGEDLEPMMVTLGSVLIVSAHLFNLKLSQVRQSCPA